MIRKTALLIIFINLICLLGISLRKKELTNQMTWFFEKVVLQHYYKNYSELINRLKYTPNYQINEYSELARVEGLDFLKWIKKQDSIYHTPHYQSLLFKAWRNKWPTNISLDKNYSCFTLPEPIVVSEACTHKLKRYLNDYQLLVATRRYTEYLERFLYADYCELSQLSIKSVHPNFDAKMGVQYRNWFYQGIYPVSKQEQPPIINLFSNNQALTFNGDHFEIQLPHNFRGDSIELEVKKYFRINQILSSQKYKVQIWR